MFSTILKKSLKTVLKQKGYQVCKIPTLENDIKEGKYTWLQDMGIRTVLDVGANVGKFTSMISEILSNVNIYSFEPLADCYKELIENTKHIANINYFNFALGEKESETTINHNEFAPSSSILKMKELHIKSFPQTAHSFNEVIQIRDLDGVNDEINWIQKTLMKIDVQGFELYKYQARFDDVYSFLV